MKYIILLLIAACVCSAQITRSNYHAGNCALSTSSLYFVSVANFQCLTGTVYPFNGETRSYTCSNGTIQYNNCTDTGCSNCNGPLVTVGTTDCIGWTTNDYSDQLTCGTTVPSTPINTPLVSQFDGNGCTGSLQYQGAYGSTYCTESGLKYSCNSTTLLTYNCTSSGCGNCSVIDTTSLNGGSVCSGFTRFQCLNSTLTNNNNTTNTTIPGTTTNRGTNITVGNTTTTRGTTGAPGAGGSTTTSDAVTIVISISLVIIAVFCAILL